MGITISPWMMAFLMLMTGFAGFVDSAAGGGGLIGGGRGRDHGLGEVRELARPGDRLAPRRDHPDLRQPPQPAIDDPRAHEDPGRDHGARPARLNPLRQRPVSSAA